MPELTPKNYSLNDHNFSELSRKEANARVRLLQLEHLKNQTPEEVAPLFFENPYTLHKLEGIFGSSGWNMLYMMSNVLVAKPN